LFAFFCLDQLRKMCAPIVPGCALQQSLVTLDLLVAAELFGVLPLDEIVHEVPVAGGSATGLSATDAWEWPLSVMGQHTLVG
jgi:hypothetical protein